MKNKDDRPKQAAELRKQAEEIAGSKTVQLRESQKALSPEETTHLLHELQVHQIELEMQNEELRQAQTQLDISQARYFDLYDLAPVGYFTLSETGLILEMNLTACSQVDKTRGTLIKQRFSSLILSDDQDIFYRHRKLLFETGAPQVYELRLTRKDAVPFWVRIDSTLAKDTEGMPICRATMIDINDRKKMDAVRDFLAKYSGSAQSEGFFELLARYLAETLNMDFICIDRLEGDGLTARTVAVWCDGKFEDNVSYALKDTPCGEVVGKSVCCFPANVCQFFPHDQVLQDLRADSYVGVTLWDHTGKPIGLIAVIGRQPLANRPLAEDILQLVAVRAAGEMERTDAEEVLRKSEELFRTLTTMAPVGLYLTTPDGHCEYVNPSWCQMAGIDIQEALGDGWIQGLHPEDRPLVFSKWQQMVQSKGQWGLEYRFQTPDKKTTWVYGLATPVRNDSGRIIKYIGINTDITERKLDEEALRESEERFRSYIEHSPYGVFVADGQGRYVDVNPASERITGYSAAQLTSMSISDILTAESRESGLNHFQTLVAEGRGPASTELGFRRADGSLGHWSVSATRIGPDRYLGFVEDITERRMAEERLQRFRRIVSSTSDGIALLDEHYRYVIVNEAYETFSGKKQEDVIGLTVSEYLGEAIFCERIKACFDRCLNGEIIKFQEWFDYPALGKRFVEITYCPYIDAMGNASGVVANTRDITERKRAEAALLEREEQLRSLASSIPGAIYQFVRRLDGVFEIPFMSEGGRLLFDRPVEELQDPSHLFDDVHPEDVPGLWASIEASAKDLTPWSTEFRLVPKTAPLRWLRGVSNPHRMPDGGISWYGVLLDITDRMEAERRLRVELQRANSYLNASATIMVALDNSGTTIMVNRYGLDLLGYEEEEIIGRNWFETALPQPEGMEQVYPEFRRIIGGDLESMRYFENEVITASGERRLIAWSNSNYLDDLGRITGTLSSGMDITDIKRAEVERENLQNQLRQAQKMESVGRLAGGVAHDFNNMLGVIFGHVEMAMEQIDPALPLYADLQGIQKAAERSSDLTRQLLAFARKQTVSPKVIDLNTTVEGMLKMLRRLIGEDIQLAWLPGVKLWHVRIDPSQIDQIMANLCVNARDAIAGAGNITIETTNITLNETYFADHTIFISGEYILITVSDDGCGMGKETLSHLFEPFFTTKETGKGTGLGLSTVYGIVKQNNGFIDVDSEPDRGATFKIYLPRHTGKTQQGQEEAPQEPVRSGKETLLLVEDEKDLLRLSQRMLEKLGYQVVPASTPGEAIHLAQEYKGDIHLLLTDVILPEMNGRDLAKSLLSLYPNMKRLFMSGYTADIIAHHGVLDDNVHFIQKPFSGKDLAAKVREALDQK